MGLNEFLDRLSISDRVTLQDAAADPSNNGEIRRNGTDVKVQTDGNVKNFNDIGGGVSTTVIGTGDSPYTTQDEDVIYAGGGAITVTLATADVTNGNGIVIVNIDGAGDITVNTEGGQTIDPGGAASKTISNAGWGSRFTSDGTNWDQAAAAEYETAAIDDLDIGSANLLSTGDFAAIGPAWEPYQRTFSTSSTTYANDAGHYNVRTTWNTWAPSGATTAILTEFIVSNSAGDVRLRNITDGEDVFEQLDIAAGTDVSRIDNYTPTTTGGTIRLAFEVKTNDGGTTTNVLDLATNAGVQV